MGGKSQDRGLSIVGPFILIGLGIVLLLQQLNVIQWSMWEVAFRLWPLIIIAVGAEILLARRSFLGAIASLVLVLALLVGGLLLMGQAPASGEALTEQVAYPLEDAATGKIEVSFDAGKLDVGALAEESGNILEGTLHGGTDYGTSSVRVENSKVTVVLRREWPHRFFYTGSDDFYWDLALSRRIPLDVSLSLGAGEVVADLTRLKVTSVDVHLGAGQVILKLPANSDIDVKVDVGAGQAVIHVSRSAPLDVHCTTGVGNCALPNSSGFWGQSYTSPGYSESENRIRIQINVGVGQGVIIQDVE